MSYSQELMTPIPDHVIHFQDTKQNAWGAMACVGAVILVIIIILAIFTSRCSQYDKTEDLRNRFVSHELGTGRWMLSMGLAYDNNIPGSLEHAQKTLSSLRKHGLAVPDEPFNMGDHFNKVNHINDQMLKNLHSYGDAHKDHHLYKKLKFAFDMSKPAQPFDAMSAENHFGSWRNYLKHLMHDSEEAEAAESQGFGQAYLKDTQRRRDIISKVCKPGIDDMCYYPLDQEARPGQALQGEKGMTDLRVLRRRHELIMRWLKQTGNAIDVQPSTRFMSKYNTEGWKKPSNRNLSGQDYSNYSGAYKPQTFIEGRDQVYTGAAQRDLTKLQSTVSAQNMSDLRPQGGQVRRQQGYGESYGPSNNIGNIIDDKARAKLISEQCTPGYAGFAGQGPCLYPKGALKKPPLPVSAHTYDANKKHVKFNNATTKQAFFLP